MSVTIRTPRKYQTENGWKTAKVVDSDHKRWNRIVSDATCELEITGHENNKNFSVFLEEMWTTEKGRFMTRAIHMQLDEQASRHVYEKLKEIFE